MIANVPVRVQVRCHQSGRDRDRNGPGPLVVATVLSALILLTALILYKRMIIVIGVSIFHVILVIYTHAVQSSYHATNAIGGHFVLEKTPVQYYTSCIVYCSLRSCHLVLFTDDASCIMIRICCRSI